MASPRLTIVVPCFNEAARLDRQAFLAFAATHHAVRFLFVNDGSADDTANVLDALCRDDPDRLHVLNLPRNAGKAEAVRQGILSALDDGPEFVGYWDADLATPLSAIAGLLGEFGSAASVEMVLGSRVRLLGRTIERRAVRHYVGRVFATAASMTLGIAVYDTQCGAKILRVTPGTRSLFDSPFTSRWVFDVELIARRLAGCAASERKDAGRIIVEHPLAEWRDVAGSKVRPHDFFVAVFGLGRIAWRYRFSGGAGRSHA